MPEYLLPLKDRREVAEETMAFWFDISGTDFTFTAGQYVDVALIDPPQTDRAGDTRSFSIASSPNEKGAIMVVTRMRPSAFKNSLKTVPLGTKVEVGTAQGFFTLHKDSTKPAVFLVGGIGITPVRSIIAWAIEEKLPHELYLFYSNRTPRAAAFLSDLEVWQANNSHFKLVATITEVDDPAWRYERGRINEAMLRKYLPAIQGLIYYIVGPTVMVNAMAQLLGDLEVSEESIKTELFSGY